LRTKRRFTEAFKRSAIARLQGASMAEVARACGVSVSVLHRWRKQFGKHSSAVPSERRKFPREFKEAAVRRLERGDSVPEVCRLCRVDANTLHRWRKEFRDYGAQAFSGYGKSRLPTEPAQTIVVRLTREEHQRLKAACSRSRAHSLSEFARAHLRRPPPELSAREFLERLNRLAAGVLRLSSAIQRAQRN
jgi:transposase-like protein